MKSNESKEEKKIVIEDGGIGYVKGYDMQSVTIKKIEKGKLGNALSEIVDLEQLESEIKEAIEADCPVWGYFKKKQMWSCYIFEKVQIDKSTIKPAPENGNDILNMFKLKHEYIHPEVEQYYDKMKASIFTGIKGTALEGDLHTDSKEAMPDGFIWGNDTYVIKKTGKNGFPFGILYGLSIGILFGIAMDNIPIGICFGIAIGSGLSTAFSAGELSKVIEPVEVSENKILEEKEDGE